MSVSPFKINHIGNNSTVTEYPVVILATITVAQQSAKPASVAYRCLDFQEIPTVPHIYIVIPNVNKDTIATVDDGNTTGQSGDTLKCIRWGRAAEEKMNSHT